MDGLHAYLTRAGFAPHPLRNLAEAGSLDGRARAIVVFPDEMEQADVQAELERMRAKQPTTLLVIVTSAPRCFVELAESNEDAGLVILPKPAFGWTILDVIRAHPVATAPARRRRD